MWALLEVGGSWVLNHSRECLLKVPWAPLSMPAQAEQPHLPHSKMEEGGPSHEAVLLLVQVWEPKPVP